MGRLDQSDQGQERIFRAAIDFLLDTKEAFPAGVQGQRLLAHADALIAILAGDDAARAVLLDRGLDRALVSDKIKALFRSAHLNPEGEHYTTLLLPRNVSQEEISRRWKSLMRLYHPDHHGDEAANMAESVKSINRAYSALKDESARSDYDRSLVRKAYVLSRKQQTGRRRPLGHRNPARLILPIVLMLCCFVVTGLVLFEQRSADFELEKAYKSRRSEGAGEPKVQATPAAVPSRPAEGALPVAREPIEEKVPTKERGPASDGTVQRAMPGTPAPVPKEVRVAVKSTVSHQVPERATQRQAAAPVLPAEAPAKPKAPEPLVSADQAGPAKASPPYPVPVRAPAVEPVPEKTAAAQASPVRLETEILAQEVQRFLTRYIAAYEKGAIDGFMDCYSSSAVENGRLRYGTIRAAYQRNFDNKAYRYALRDVRHQQKGDVIVVTGSYEISRVGGTSTPSRGRIVWTLQREGGELRIARVDYTKQ